VRRSRTLREKCRSSASVLTLALTGIAGCGSDGGDPAGPNEPGQAPVATVTVAPTSATLVPQQSVELSATLRDAAGNTLAGRTVTWSSDTQGTASVNGSGSGATVTASAPGPATITATSEQRTGSATITVVDGGFVGAAGGQVTAAGGAVQLQVPAGALSTGTALTVTPVAGGPNPPAGGVIVSGTAWNLGPTGTSFAQPVTVTIRYEASAVGELDPAGFRLHRWTGSSWEPLASESVNPGTREVSGTTSTFSTFAILGVPDNPVPSVTALSPESAQAGGAAFTMTVTGTGFVAGSQVRWDGEARPTAHVSPTELQAEIGAADIAQPGTAQVTVVSPLPGGGESAAIGFEVKPDVVVPPAAVPGISVSDHSCGVTTAGEAWCWGVGFDHRLGNGSSNNRLVPTAVAGGHTFVSVSAGGAHTCALTTDGTAFCWGLNDSTFTRDARGALGDGTTVTRPTPTAVAGGLSFREVATGANYSCGVTVDSAAYCWGNNTFGQLGDGTTVDRLEPVPVSGGHLFATVVPGPSGIDPFTCGIDTAGRAWCWGRNQFGNLGNGTSGASENRLEPTAVLGGHTFVSISPGRRHTCALDTTGAAWCWGSNIDGNLGDGTDEPSLAPVQVLGGHIFATISSAIRHNCAVTLAGEAWCWGSDASINLLGHGSSGDSWVPIAVAGGHAFKSISAGAIHTCGVTLAGEGLCWGSGNAGRLGHGTTEFRTVPHPVSGGHEFR